MEIERSEEDTLEHFLADYPEINNYPLFKTVLEEHPSITGVFRRAIEHSKGRIPAAVLFAFEEAYEHYHHGEPDSVYCPKCGGLIHAEKVPHINHTWVVCPSGCSYKHIWGMSDREIEQAKQKSQANKEQDTATEQ